jgi:uncharacterized membrane protein
VLGFDIQIFLAVAVGILRCDITTHPWRCLLGVALFFHGSSLVSHLQH